MIKLFRYAGSKGRYLNSIIPLIDKNKILVEPFLGSGIVLLNSDNSVKYGNDVNANIIDIFIGFQKSSYKEYCDFIDRKNPEFIKHNKDSYYNFRNYYNKNYNNLSYSEKAFYQWICIQSCTNGMARWGKNGFNQGFGSRSYNKFDINSYNSLTSSIKNMKLTSDNFFNLTHLDSNNTVWFLDPPYLTNKMSYNESFDDDMSKKFINTIINFKGDVLYTDTLNEYNKHLIEKHHWNYIELGSLWSTSPRKISKNTSTKEYLFYNFQYKQSTLFD